MRGHLALFAARDRVTRALANTVRSSLDNAEEDPTRPKSKAVVYRRFHSGAFGSDETGPVPARERLGIVQGWC